MSVTFIFYPVRFPCFPILQNGRPKHIIFKCFLFDREYLEFLSTGLLNNLNSEKLTPIFKKLL